MGGLIEALIRAYRNERSTKELLTYERKIMLFLSKNLPRQSEYAESVKKHPALKSIYEQEVERVKYFMKEYVLARMRKINQNFYVDTSLLSESEALYCDALRDMYRTGDVLVDTRWTNNEFVGFISLVNNKNIFLDSNSVELKQGDFFVAPLRDVIDLLHRNEIYLV